MTVLFINGSPVKRVIRRTGRKTCIRCLTPRGITDYALHFEHDQRETGRPQQDSTDDYEQLMTQFATFDDIVRRDAGLLVRDDRLNQVFMDRWFDSYTHDFLCR